VCYESYNNPAHDHDDDDDDDDDDDVYVAVAVATNFLCFGVRIVYCLVIKSTLLLLHKLWYQRV
jgi:hypothetical protein